VNTNWRLGDLAALVETHYGERSLAEYAEAIGIKPSTLNQYRWVSERWPIHYRGNESEPKPWTIFRELAGEDDRFVLVDMVSTVKEARELVAGRKTGDDGGEEESDDEQDQGTGLEECPTCHGSGKVQPGQAVQPVPVDLDAVSNVDADADTVPGAEVRRLVDEAETRGMATMLREISEALRWNDPEINQLLARCDAELDAGLND
jgi:hypothetical protein